MALSSSSPNQQVNTPGTSQETGISANSQPATKIIRVSGNLLVFPMVCLLPLVTANQFHSVLENSDPHVSFLPALLIGVVMWWWWGLIAASLWLLSRQYPAIVTFTRRGILLHALIGAGLVLLHLEMLQATIRFTIAFWSVALQAGYNALNYLNISQFGLELLLYAFVLGVAGIVSLKLRAQQDALRAMELHSKLSEARLLALQIQCDVGASQFNSESNPQASIGGPGEAGGGNGSCRELSGYPADSL
jgi:hypothetical protein